MVSKNQLFSNCFGAKHPKINSISPKKENKNDNENANASLIFVAFIKYKRENVTTIIALLIPMFNAGYEVSIIPNKRFVTRRELPNISDNFFILIYGI